jgi:hypothetical protein
MFLGGPYCGAAELPQAVTKGTVLQWGKAHRDAQPNFHPGETLSFGDLEKLWPFLPQATMRSLASLRSQDELFRRGITPRTRRTR